MKPNFLLCIMLLTQVDNCFAVPPGEYQILINIKDGIKDGKAFIRYFTPKGPYRDSANIINGQGAFKGTVPDKMTIGRIHVMPDGQQDILPENTCEVWLENAVIKIEAKKHLIDAEFTGTAVQEQFTELQKSLRGIKIKESALNQLYEKAVSEKDEKAKNKLIEHDYPALFKEKQQILGTFIRKYPASPISAQKFADFAGDGEMDLSIVEPTYALLDEKIKSTNEVKDVARLIEINKRTAPGMNALPFTQNDTSGNAISLADFQGKYVLIDFWAGWCVPCRAENPHLIQLYNTYRSKGFEILGVSLDGERKRWTNAIRTDKLEWPQVSDLQIFDNVVAKQYGITSIPQNILISPAGKIIAKNLRGEKLDATLAEIFGH